MIGCGLVIKDHIQVENICRCRESRQWGKICGHSLAVGLEILHPRPKTVAAPAPAVEEPAVVPAEKVLPIRIADDGSVLRLAVILPPNMSSALGTGRVSVFFEAMVDGSRMPMAMLRILET